MADDPQRTPSGAPVETVVEDGVVTARVRRFPRYGVFLALGGALGVLAAMILTFAFDSWNVTADNGAVYTQGQVFGFLAVAGIAVGVCVGALIGLLVGRIVGRRTREVTLERETVRTEH